jgi:hypothetical protein
VSGKDERARVCAHIIVGAREEPFLRAVLASLNGVAQTLIVNDNSGRPTRNRAVIEESAFGQDGRLLIDDTPFIDFATARNRCLEVHARHGCGEWILFADADEVHDVAAARIASRLAAIPHDIGSVDGYLRHYFATPDWYKALDRRRMLVRFSPDLRWTRPVHEHLTGVRGKSLALPYVYGHYGYVLPPRRSAEKGRIYHDLGWPGHNYTDEELDTLDAREFWREYWTRLLPFTGAHPPAVRSTLDTLRREFSSAYEEYDTITRAHRTPVENLRNTVRRLNFEQRWRIRVLNPRAFALTGAKENPVNLL